MSEPDMEYTYPSQTTYSAIQQDESYWAKIYAGQIAAGNVARQGAVFDAKQVARAARELAREMCKEGEGNV